jgi:hypothetical protein
MKHLRFILIFQLLCGAFGARAQQNAAPHVVELPQGGFAAFRLKTVATRVKTSASESSSSELAYIVPQILIDENNLAHRVLVDESGAPVFAYDIAIESLAASKQFKIAVKPVDKTFAARLAARRSLFARESSASNIPTLAQTSESKMIADGETFALDLLVNPKSGMKIVDYVTLAFDRARLYPPSKPRDFGVTNVELAMKNFQLRIDGEPVKTASARRDCRGALLWFYLPGQGRFIVSLAPRAGYDFRKVGMIEENTIAFTWDGARYEWISSEPIIGSGGVWNLWVLHDASYTPFLEEERRNVEEAGKTEEPNHSEIERVLNDPVGAIIRNKNGKNQDSIQSKQPTSAPKVKRVRVQIGGAGDIESLLPKK